MPLALDRSVLIQPQSLNNRSVAIQPQSLNNSVVVKPLSLNILTVEMKPELFNTGHVQNIKKSVPSKIRFDRKEQAAGRGERGEGS